MNVTIVSWNMAGSKVFDKLDGRPDPAAGTYTRHFQEVWNNNIIPYLHAPSWRPDNRTLASPIPTGFPIAVTV